MERNLNMHICKTLILVAFGSVFSALGLSANGLTNLGCMFKSGDAPTNAAVRCDDEDIESIFAADATSKEIKNLLLEEIHFLKDPNQWDRPLNICVDSDLDNFQSIPGATNRKGEIIIGLPLVKTLYNIGHGMAVAPSESIELAHYTVIAVIAHEWGHQFQYEKLERKYKVYLPTPQSLLRSELEADAIAGALLYWKWFCNDSEAKGVEIAFDRLGTSEFWKSDFHGYGPQRRWAAHQGLDIAKKCQNLQETLEEIHKLVYEKGPPQQTVIFALNELTVKLLSNADNLQSLLESGSTHRAYDSQVSSLFNDLCITTDFKDKKVPIITVLPYASSTGPESDSDRQVAITSFEKAKRQWKTLSSTPDAESRRAVERAISMDLIKAKEAVTAIVYGSHKETPSNYINPNQATQPNS